MKEPGHLVERWIDQLIDRHTRPFTSAEYLKAVRALSARYVQRRSELPRRPPADTAGKRAAFSAFYTPLHFLTAQAAISALAPGTSLRTLVDLGCGTGPAGAAWALSQEPRPQIIGVDLESWALDEATRNWKALGLTGRTRRANLGQAASDLAALGPRAAGPDAVVLGWSVNELAAPDREKLLASLLTLHARGTAVLILEPLARSAVPWWDTWARAIERVAGRVDEWRFDVTLPPRLAALDEAAGFDRQALTARTLWIPPA